MMRVTRRTLISRRREDGVSLIMVLVTLVVFGLLVPVLGQFGSVNGISAFVVKEQRSDRYAADSGMQGAIAWAQAQRTAGRVFTDCPEVKTGVLPGSSSSFDRSVSVKCQGFKGSGVTQETPSMPAYALLALAQGGSEDGIHVRGGGAAKTSGAWWSNMGSNDAIDVDSDVSIDASADLVGGQGRCRNIEGAPTRCNLGAAGVVANPGLGGGGWAFDLPTPIDPARSACSEIPPSRVISVAPGLHWQRKYFDDLTDGDCGDVVVWLMPGTHVFDLTFYGESDDEWRIDPESSQVAVIGGTPSGWDADASASQVGAAISAIGADSGACNPDAEGAVVAVGRSTRLRVETGNFEVCGKIEGQRIAVAQVTAGVDDTPIVPSPESTPTTATHDQERGTFGWPDSLSSPNVLEFTECEDRPNPCGDSSTVITGLLRGSRARGAVRMQVPDPTPRGAYLQKIRLSITHRESESRNGDLDRLRVWITGLPGAFDSECTLARSDHSLPDRPGWQTDPFECDVSDVHEPYFNPTSFLTVNYEAELRSPDEDDPEPRVELGLDRVSIVADHIAPAIRNSTPSGDMFRVDGGATARLDGTVYMPSADVRADFGSSTRSSFRRGVIAGTLDVRNLPNDPSFAPFSLPGGGSYADRLVTFAAYLDGDSSGEPILTARVRFCDFQPEGGPSAVDHGCDGTPGQPPKVIAWEPKR